MFFGPMYFLSILPIWRIDHLRSADDAPLLAARHRLELLPVAP